MDYDRILSYIGEFGYYQKRACLLICIAAIPIGIQGTNIVFQSFRPSFRCAVPGLLNDTYQIQDEYHARLIQAFIPLDQDTGLFSGCRKYDLAYHPNFGNVSIPNHNKSTACDRWVYNVDEFGTSMAMELNLVCERAIYKTHINMMIMLGILVGSLVGGSLSDYFGRKKILVITLMIQCLCGILLAFAGSIPVIIAIRFIMSCAGVTVFLVIFVLLAELVGASRRTFATMSSMFGWCAGLFILLIVQYFIRDWRTSQIVQTAPFFLFAVYWWVLQESPRWLLTSGKFQEAEDIIKYMAKVNKVQLPQEMEPVNTMPSFLESDEQRVAKPKHTKVWHMCYQPALAFRIVILAFCWVIINMVYYGLVLGVGDLIDGDLFLNFALQSAMEVVSNVVCVFALEKIGRKKIFCSGIISAGISCLSLSIMMITKADHIRWLTVVLFCLGKFGITLAFSLIYIVTAELLPTTVRNSGLGFCSFVGRIGGVISPYIASASMLIEGPVGKALPVLLFGGFSLVAGLSSLWLPETRNKKLPETIADARHFHKIRTSKNSGGKVVVV